MVSPAFKLIFIIFIKFVQILAHKAEHNCRKLPDGFIVGTASASYQVEGAWNESSKYGFDKLRCLFIIMKLPDFI